MKNPVTNQEYIQAIISIMSEKKVKSVSFFCSEYEFLEDIPFCKTLRMRVGCVSIPVPMTDKKFNALLEITAYDKVLVQSSVTLDGTQDEDYDYLFHAVYDELQTNDDNIEADAWLDRFLKNETVSNRAQKARNQARLALIDLLAALLTEKGGKIDLQGTKNIKFYIYEDATDDYYLGEFKPISLYFDKDMKHSSDGKAIVLKYKELDGSEEVIEDFVDALCLEEVSSILDIVETALYEHWPTFIF